MLIKFWGVRGSVPSPITSTVFRNKVTAILNRLTPRDLESAANREIFLAHLPPELFGTIGGNTTCLEIRSDEDEIFIVDGGTGLRELGQNLNYPKDKGMTFHFFFTHFHWDHLQGLPFFAPFFNPKNTIHFYSPVKGFENILREQMKTPYFPVPMSVFPSTMVFHELSGEPLNFGGMNISYRAVYHPQGCTAYRFEERGRVAIFSTDTELKTSDFHKTSENVTFYENVDILILDAQYTLGEAIDKTNWGHSSYSMAVDFALEYGIKKLFLFHHEPNYSDAYLEDIKRLALWYLQHNGHDGLEIDLAREGVEIDL